MFLKMKGVKQKKDKKKFYFTEISTPVKKILTLDLSKMVTYTATDDIAEVCQRTSKNRVVTWSD